MSDNTAREAALADRFTDDSPRVTGDTIDMRGVIITLRKFKWPIILVTAISTATTALLVSTMTPVYRATSTLLFEQETKNEFVNPLVNFSGYNAGYIETQVEVLQSRKLAERVVDKLKLDGHWEYNAALVPPVEFQKTTVSERIGQLLAKVPMVNEIVGGEKAATRQQQQVAVYDRDRAIRKLLKRVAVQQLKRTQLVKVSVEGVDPGLASQIANEIGESYVDHYLDAKDSQNREAFDWLDNKVVELKGKLEKSEAGLLLERQRIGLTDQGNSLSERQIDILTTRLLDSKGAMEEAKIAYDEVRSAGSIGSGAGEVTFNESGSAQVTGFRYVGTPYESLPVVDSSALVQRNKIGMQEAKRQLDELYNRYGDRHPRVVDAKSNLETATKNLDRQIANVVSSVEKKYRAAAAGVRSIQTELDSQKSRGYQIGREQIKLVELEREVETNKLLYQEAYQRLREADEAEGLQSVNMSITDPAATPEFPVKPAKSLMVILGFILSLFGSSALAFAYESMKETVQGIHDVEKKLRLSVYGIVPVIRSGLLGRKSAPLIPGSFADKRGAFEESIRTIRTSATLAELESHNQVIMVTSSVPGEGKSTVASNLAYSFSKLENTLLIEADMRRPGLGRALGIRNHGLSELLQSRAYLEDCLRIDEIGTLDLIAAGASPENHLELLASPQFEDLIVHLKTRYDRIIIDLAPVQAVSDALVVGKFCDAGIYVIKADSTPLPVAKRGVSRLIEVGINVAGAVISQVDINKVSSYGGDYYYQGYYDYYGYGDNAPTVNRTPPKDSGPGGNRRREPIVDQRDDVDASRFTRRDPFLKDQGSNAA